MVATSVNPSPAVSCTMKIGSANRTTKTAMKMPTVRNSICQNLDMWTRTLAFTTALSKLNVTSSTTSTRQMKSAEGPARIPVTASTASVNNAGNQNDRANEESVAT